MNKTPGGAPKPSERDEVTREFVRLLAVHERRLSGYILALVPNLTAADDIAQETKIRLWEQFDQFDRSKDFGAWANTIAYYEVLSYRKRVGRSKLKFSDDFSALVASEIDARYEEGSARQDALMECLETLTDRNRHLLKVCYSSEDGISAAADRLGRTLAATRKALFRIRLTLRECIERRLREDQP